MFLLLVSFLASLNERFWGCLLRVVRQVPLLEEPRGATRQEQRAAHGRRYRGRGVTNNDNSDHGENDDNDTS